MKTSKGVLGFTLIELLIVISIILIISTLGIGSYRSMRSAITIDLEADKFVALLQSLESQTRSTSQSKGPQCIEVVFQKNSMPQQHTASYKNAVDGCDWDSQKNLPLGLAADVVVTSDVTVRFTPPEGRMKIMPEAGVLTIALKQNPSMMRTISLNASSGTIQKIKP